MGDAKPNVHSRHSCGSLRHSYSIILPLHMTVWPTWY